MIKWSILVLMATVSLLCLPSNSFARGRCFGGHCVSSGGCYSSCYTPCYTPPVIVQEVPVVPVFAYPVLVPAFQFQYVPPTTVAAVPVVPVTGYPVATPIIQPVAQPYSQYGQPAYGQPPVAQPQYGQPQYGQPQQNFNLNNKEKIRELAKALIEEMNRMADSNDGPPAVPGTQFESQPPPQPQPQPPNQQLGQRAVNALHRTCANCHTGVGSKHEMIIFNQPGMLNQSANWKKIKEEIRDKRMPPKDHQFQLTPQERDDIIKWLESLGVNG